MLDRRFRFLCTVCLIGIIALPLAACGALSGGDPVHNTTAMLYSPNGEPLNGGPLGKPSCSEAFSRWYDRADADHDGKLTRAEFRADAQAAFARMEIDHNGFLLPEELERYRFPFRQEDIAPHRSDDDSDKPRHRNHGFGFGDDGGAASASRNAPRAQPDPVMAADLNSDFKVTPREFAIHAESVFDRLELGHTGVMDRDALLKRCEPAGHDGFF